MPRFLIAFPFAIAISVALFSFMAWMVDNGHQRVSETSPGLSFNVVMVQNEQQLQRRQRSAPEQPKAPEPPPEARSNQTKAQVNHNLKMDSMPSLSLDTAISGLAINAPSFGDIGSNQQAMPLHRVEPRYPAKALKRGAEGYVVMAFTIDETGRPTDISVLDSNPKRMFEREALRALKKWKYQPKIVNGNAIMQQDQTVRLEFRLAK